MPLVHGKGPLTPDRGFTDQADVLVRARTAGDALGATRMDRPEWIAVDGSSKTVYCTLTNNTARGKTAPVNAANPRPNTMSSGISCAGTKPARTLPRRHSDWSIFALGDPQHPDPGQRGSAKEGSAWPDGASGRRPRSATVVIRRDDGGVIGT